MKKLMFILLGVVGVVAANAQFTASTSVTSKDAITASSDVTAVATINQEDRVKIKAEELPQTIKTALEGDEYRGWLINAAYHNKTKDTYEVELKNGAETKTIKFDKDGKKVA